MKKILLFLRSLLKRNLPTHGPASGMSLAYTDRAGYRYYTYDHPLEMPIRRLIAAESASRFLEMNLNRETLIRMLNLMEQAANKGQIVNLFHYLQELKARTELLGEEDCLLALAACYFIRNDENPDNTSLHDEKIKHWKTDPNALRFFLNACLQLSNESEPNSSNDFPNYSLTLNKIEPLVQELNLLSSLNPSGN